VTTVYLGQDRAPVRVRRGGQVVTVEPGTYADVPDTLLEVVLGAGAIKRSRPTEQDEPEA
jgi:hypothetical protein